jgi:hypothetical protein
VALEGLLSDLRHHREALLDRRLAGAVDRRAGVGGTVATSRDVDDPPALAQACRMAKNTPLA